MRALCVGGAIALLVYCAPFGACDLSGALDYMASRQESYVNELKEFVALSSVSGALDKFDSMRKTAEWLAVRLRKAGFEDIRVPDTNGPCPAVLGTLPAQDPDALTVLLYGHYDVQPADPESDWSSPPFELRSHGGSVYGRGVSGNKGGVAAAVQGLEAIAQSGGLERLNVKVLIEGEKEILSPSFREFASKHASELSCDLALSLLGSQPSLDSPALTLGFRGAAAMDIRVSALAHELRAGPLDGAVQNPAAALVAMLASLRDAEGRVLVPGFYEGAGAPSAADRDDVLAQNFDDRAELVEGLGALDAHGEPGLSSLERSWLRPALEVVRVHAGRAWPTPAAASFPADARATVVARLAGSQTPAQVIAAVEKHLAERLPHAVNVTVTESGVSALPYTHSGPKGARPVVVAARALSAVFGKEATSVRSGGAAPALAALRDVLGVDTVSLPATLTRDALRWTDERLSLDMFHASREGLVRVLHAYDADPTLRGGKDEL